MKNRFILVLLVFLLLFQNAVYASEENIISRIRTEMELSSDKWESAPFEAVLRMEDEYFYITEDMTKEWRYFDGEQYKWNKPLVESYFDTIGKNIFRNNEKLEFCTHNGDKIIFDNIGFSWKVDIEAATDYFMNEVDNDEYVIDPIWETDESYKKNLMIGDNYIEVDIDNQTVWVYQNGKVAFSTACVTGLKGISDTNKGIYRIAYKEKDVVLRGTNRDGTKYESPVKYWMPFNMAVGEGLHDASWRDEFGGEIYKTDGSHGCVNLPTSSARIICEKYAENGTPVIVH